MMRKKILAMAVGISLSMPLWSGVVNASVLDNPQDKVYVEHNVLPDNGKAKKEMLTMSEVEKLAPLTNKLVDKQVIPEAARLYTFWLFPRLGRSSMAIRMIRITKCFW